MSGSSVISGTSSSSRTRQNASSSAQNSAERARQKTAHKDDNVRRKLDKEQSTHSLSAKAPAKSTPSSSSGHTKAGASTGMQGAVLRLKPNPPIPVPENMSISAAAKLMASKRADSLLVVASPGHDDGDDGPHHDNGNGSGLVGIITDKDIAFRVVAANLAANETQVGQVMTPNPTYVSSSTEANEALLKMAQGRFRHLPVVDGDHLVGVLDIIKCLYETTSKLEKAYEAAKALYEATSAASSQWSGLDTEAMLENLKQRMNCPPVSSVVETDSVPVVGPKSTVREAAKVMKQEHASAVLVVEHNKLVGIFTTKDIVLRVIGNGLDPDVTSIVRVMTPHPTTVGPDYSVLDALKMMQQGRYLHLPVVNDDQSVYGLVDVLLLTYSTLGQVDNVERGGAAPKKEPAWKTFWNASLAAEDENRGPIIGRPASDYSTGDSHHHHHHGGPASLLDDNFDSVSMASGGGVEEESMGSFTFKISGPDGTVHRFSSKNADLKALKEAVTKKCGPIPAEGIKYVDEEGDLVLLGSDEDLFDAVNLARGLGWKRIQLVLGDGEESEEEVVAKKPGKKGSEKTAVPAPAPAPAPVVVISPAPQVQESQPQQQRQQPVSIPAASVSQSSSNNDNKQSEYLQIHPNYVIAGLGVALVAVLIYAIRK